jgi:hypothetical protein
MPLPSHEVILEIHESIQQWNKKYEFAKKPDFENCKNFLERAWGVVKEGAQEVAEESGKFIIDQVAERRFETVGIAAHGAAVHVAGVAVVGVGMLAVAPLSAVVGVWKNAYEVSEMAEGIFGLYDLLELAKKPSGRHDEFQCICTHCAKNIKYIIDKGEWRVLHIAVSVATLGVWWGAKKAHSAIKSMQPTSKKCQVSKELVEAAKSGCSVATLTIFLRVADKMGFEAKDKKNDKKFDIKREEKRKATNKKTLATVAAIICSEDGWQEFKELW